MANDKITLAKLDIDVSSLVASQEQAKKAMQETQTQLFNLKEAGKQNTEEYKKASVTLVELTARYKNADQLLNIHINNNQELIKNQQDLEAALEKSSKTENEYIDNNKELLSLRKDLNTGSANYAENIAKINVKLAENTSWLKENGSANTKLVTTMDDYKTQVSESFDSINVFNGGLSGFISRAQEAGGTMPLMKNAFNGISTGIKGMGTAITANPVGAILAVIVLVVQALYSAFKSFAPLMDKVEQAMAAVSAVTESIKNSFLALFDASKSIGEVFSGFASSAADAATEAIKLKKAQQELADAMVLQEVANEKAAKQIDELTLRSKDQTISEKERAQAIADVAVIEQDTQKKNQDLADKAYTAAIKKIEVGRNLTDTEKKRLAEEGYAYAQQLADKKDIDAEELEALKDAYGKKIQAERDGIALTQKVRDAAAADQAEKDDAIQKAKDKAEQDDKARVARQAKMLDDYTEKLQLQFDMFMQQQDGKARSLEQELALNKEILDKKIAMAIAEYNASDKMANDRLKRDKAENDAKLQRLKDNAEATATFAQKEIDLYVAQHQSVLEGVKQLTPALIKEEQARLEQIKAMKLKELALEKDTNDEEIAAKRSRNEALTTADMDYLTTKAQLETDFKKTTDANNAALDDQAKAQAVTQLAADDEIKRANAKAGYEQDAVDEDIRHQEKLTNLAKQLQDNAITQAQFDQLSEIETKEHEDKLAGFEKARQDAKIKIATDTFMNVALLMGKESAAGKAMAIAQATIDTYKAAVSAYGAMAEIPIVGPVLGAIAAAAAVAAGIANIKKISSTKTPKAEKGALFSIGGQRHSEGGTLFTGADGTQFEAEKGELIGVMNRNAAHHFMAFNNAFPAGGGSAPNYFAGGGIVSREIAQKGIDTDELAAKIAMANRALPAPVVAVQDIVAQGNSYVQVRERANF